MVKAIQGNLISADLRPAYYDDFRCLMGGCRLNCCMASWHIAFSRKDYLTLKKQKGSPELNEKLGRCLRRIRGEDLAEMRYAEFVKENNKCPLLGEDCLCRLQREKGSQVLPFVCRSFPRQEIAEPSGFFERSLSPACEGVLSLLWNLPDGVNFRSDPIPKELRTIIPIHKDEPFALWFQDIRSLCIDFLQDRRRPLPQRILLMGLALKDLADGEGDIPRWLDKSRNLLEQGDTAEILQDLDTSRTLDLVLHNNIRALLTMQNDSDAVELLNILEQWLSLDLQNNQITASHNPYLDAHARYQERFGDRDYFMENLMVALFFHMKLPDVKDPGELWKSYVNFCNVYAVYHFTAVMSCRDGAPADRDELFRLLVLAGRGIIHSKQRQTALRNRFFRNDSSTLAHMAILLCGA